MRFVGGRVQEEFVEQIRGKDPGRCLMVPVDVGKRAAAALVSDLYGEVVVDAFRFDLDEPGVGGSWRLLVTSPMSVMRSWCGWGWKRPVTTTGC